ncbi:unnamed protein product [Mytilus edulis]|uniref:QRICH1-like domain-containing protein n=1 Tax=Mytilus edulis TaxID=6550 RepID=A0A8S3RFK3_MYTED|nr:unnamed protein product [Mytilus edulis]
MEIFDCCVNIPMKIDKYFQIISKHDTEWELEDLDLIQTQQLVFSDNKNRFSNPVSTTEFEKRISDRIPAKTKSSTNWSVNVWQTWAENRNCNPITATEHYTCVPVEMKSADLQQIDFWMYRFIMECRREDGSPYPHNTLINLTNGLQRYLRENGRPEIFFLQKNTSTGFDDSAVKSRSGHRSNAVETYKRQSIEMSRNISDALQPPLPAVSDDKENIPTISNVSCSRPTDQKAQSNNDENELIIHKVTIKTVLMKTASESFKDGDVGWKDDFENALTEILHQQKVQGLNYEKLICPFDSKRLNVGAGYQSLADNIKKFHELRLMPEGINVCIENLDEGSGIAQSFIDQKACWHKSCNLKLNRTKLNRAEKRTSHERIDDKATTSKKKTRHSFSVQSTSNPSVCFFCNENGQEALH